MKSKKYENDKSTARMPSQFWICFVFCQNDWEIKLILYLGTRWNLQNRDLSEVTARQKLRLNKHSKILISSFGGDNTDMYSIVYCTYLSVYNVYYTHMNVILGFKKLKSVSF